MEPRKLAERVVNDPESMLEILGDLDTASEYMSAAIELYEKREEFPIVEFAPEKVPIELIIAGDVHGDLFVARKVVSHFLKRFDEGKGRTDVKLLFLGDIIDRPPNDVPYGGLLTLFYLLSLKISYPDSVHLLRGNHECHDLEPFFPHELPDEVGKIYGEENKDRVMTLVRELFSHLPIMARTSNGLLASHAGFPWSFKGSLKELERNDGDSILQTTWGDPLETGSCRGIISNVSYFDEREFSRFMEKAGCNVFVRGHLPELNGCSMYGGRMVTIFTSRRYEGYGAGGVLIAELEMPLGDRIMAIDELKVKKLSDQGFTGYNLDDGSVSLSLRENDRMMKS